MRPSLTEQPLKFNALTQIYSYLIELQLQAMTILTRHKQNLLAEYRIFLPWEQENVKKQKTERIGASPRRSQTNSGRQKTYKLSGHQNGRVLMLSLNPYSELYKILIIINCGLMK